MKHIAGSKFADLTVQENQVQECQQGILGTLYTSGGNFEDDWKSAKFADPFRAVA